MISLVGQKVLQSTEQIGAKSPAFLFCILQGTTFQQSRKESMSQFPRYIFTATFAFQKKRSLAHSRPRKDRSALPLLRSHRHASD